jgi:hypothetical protein
LQRPYPHGRGRLSRRWGHRRDSTDRDVSRKSLQELLYSTKRSYIAEIERGWTNFLNAVAGKTLLRLTTAGARNYNIEYPPSIRQTAPVMYEEASEAR